MIPKDFAFPTQHYLWTPLRANVAGVPRLQGPSIRVFGRLAPGVTMERAQAELTGLGFRAAADFPETNQHLRPRNGTSLPLRRGQLTNEAAANV